MTTLADRYGGKGRAVETSAPRARGALELALENAVEGAVRETFGAAVSIWCAERASDPLVRHSMAEVAPDEHRHAALALEIAQFLDERMTPAERDMVRDARHAGLNALRATFSEDPPRELRDIAGLPSAAEAQELFALLERLVWSADAEPRPERRALA
jgi:hypothetical protein